ncbi:MAG: 30S ribosomal protein S1 [Deltaproteobacteria bacterium]|nr:30S ribosomal protein S1 [Deltaproteobacteria bacterium]
MSNDESNAGATNPSANTEAAVVAEPTVVEPRAGEPSGDTGDATTASQTNAASEAQVSIGTEGAESDGATDGRTEGDLATAAEASKKKRRRRRRKKKAPNAEAAGAPAGDAETMAGESPDEDEDGDEEDASAEAAATAEGASNEGPSSDGSASTAKPKKKKRKPAPPAERPAFNVGDEIFGRVSKVSRDAVFVDVAGGKAVGLFDRAQLIAVPPLVGEQFIAKVKGFSTRGGMLMLGPEPFDTKQTRLELRVALESKNPIECWVTGLVKGGIEVDYNGVRGFAPASHVELVPGASLVPLLGEKLPFVVTQYGKKGRDLVLSRKEMLEKESTEKRQELLTHLQPGMVCKAVVRNVLAWGVFAALPEHGDIEGMIHMTEVSHDRGTRLDKVVSAGDVIDVKVLRIDEKGKLWLSRKATVEDPWASVAEKYAVGSVHRATVARLTDFGAFIQLEPGIDGLCHVADLSFEPVDHPNKVVKEGEEIEVIVVSVDREKHRVALHPAPPEEERDKPRVKIVLNQLIKVVVKQIKDAGLGVRIVGITGRNSRGFIPAGQTGTPRGTDLRKTFPLGTVLDAKVIEHDPRRGETRLSIRALKDDEEKSAYREYRKKVAREATFGTFGDLLKKNLER